MASRRASLPPSVLCSLNYVFTAWPPVRQAVKAFLKRSHIGWLWAVRYTRVSDRGKVGMVHR